MFSHIFPHFSGFPHHVPMVFVRFSVVFAGWRLAHHLLRFVTGDVTVATNAAADDTPWPKALQLWSTARRRRWRSCGDLVIFFWR
jgi:hypothetical protein